MMTFEQFQATGHAVDDLGDHINDARFVEIQDANEIVRTPGRLYLDSLYIENVTENWPDAARTKGKWYLLLERDEWISDDLAGLERQLYEWAMNAGFADHDVDAACAAIAKAEGK